MTPPPGHIPMCITPPTKTAFPCECDAMPCGVLHSFGAFFFLLENNPPQTPVSDFFAAQHEAKVELAYEASGRLVGFWDETVVPLCCLLPLTD